MKGKEKKRLNLYLDKELIGFAKDWSYVTDIPISRMLEEYLREQQQLVGSISPFQWLSDPSINPTLPAEKNHFEELEEYIRDQEEKKFCLENPDHPRAKIRRSLLKEYEKYVMEKLEGRKAKEKELIQRWMEVFQSKD